MPPSTSPRRAKASRRYSTTSVASIPWSAKLSPPSTVSRGRRPLLNKSKSMALNSRAIVTDVSDYEPHSEKLWSSLERPEKEHDRPGTRVFSYASLPSTPITESAPSRSYHPSPQRQRSPESPHSSPEIRSHAPSTVPFSLWDYLREELLATDFDSHQELKWERVSNFLQIPLAMEKIIGFGFILCLDSFMYTFTILPIRFVLAFFRLVSNMITNVFVSLTDLVRSKPSPRPSPLPPSQKADLLRTLLLVLTVAILVPLTDASKIYHTIRGQDTIKLYVIFNALEIGDRLCASIGQDILDCLFSRSTLEYISHRKRVTSHSFRPLFFFFLALAYNVAHALLMVYQLIALNVAVNSYDHALLTLLVSNQFVEIKGSVFKKFEKDNLFQITCADIVERFTLALMLTVVAFRNLIELSGSEFSLADGFVLPRSFGWIRGGNSLLWTISYPVLTVMASEMVVDWLKHAFITKFNHIRPSVYERYTDVLCRDLASGSAVGRRGARKHTYVDQSPLVARRLGFASLPLAVLAILVGSQSIALLFTMNSDSSPPKHSVAGWWDSKMPWAQLSSQEIVHYIKWATMGLLFWLCFVVVKVMMGVQLVSYATRRRAGMEAREAGDMVNDFGRNPVGEGKEEQIYNRELKTLLDNDRDDATVAPDLGEIVPGKGKQKRVPLEDLTRYTMIKRIW